MVPADKEGSFRSLRGVMDGSQKAIQRGHEERPRNLIFSCENEWLIRNGGRGHNICADNQYR